MFRTAVVTKSSLRLLAVALASAAVATTATGWYASASTRTAGVAGARSAATATPAKAYVGRFNVGTTKNLSKKKHAITETPKLPAGEYLVDAAVNLAMYPENGTQCYLISAKGNKSGLGQAEEAQAPTGSSGNNANLSIVDSFTKVASGDKIVLVCRDYAEGSTPTKVNSAEINAVPVHAISTHRTT